MKCIRVRRGPGHYDIIRVDDSVAGKAVNEGRAEYATKGMWKTLGRKCEGLGKRNQIRPV